LPNGVKNMFLSKEFDQKLIAAFEIYNRKLCDSLPSDQELEGVTFSKDFERKMLKLIAMQKKSYYYLIDTVGKRVAIIILAIVMSLTATTFGVKAIREAVIEFFTETFEKFTQVTLENEAVVTEQSFVKASPQYVPEGYAFESEVESYGFYRIVYRNPDKSSINFVQKINYGTNYNVDTENTEYEKISVNSFEGIRYVKNGMNTVVFADNEYMYDISGKAPFEELIKIAESIKAD